VPRQLVTAEPGYRTAPAPRLHIARTRATMPPQLKQLSGGMNDVLAQHVRQCYCMYVVY
jgi:hypothetical protein